MKRRFMMWITIVCILVVGGSVTKMTRDFVASQGVGAAAGLNVVDAGNRTNVTTVFTDETVAEIAAGAQMETIEAFANAADEEVQGAPEAEGIEAAEEAAPAEMSEVLIAASPKAPIDTTKNEAIQETVKSPLDPVVVKDELVEAEEVKVSYRAEDFFERFAQTEQNALQLWDNVTVDNHSAYLTVAEQERALWDYELNQVYQIIRSGLTNEEIEALKVLEVEWLKERDLYAEKASAKSSMKNAQNQNPDYVRALAEKTKERCYWLVSEYEDVLNRE